MTIIKYAFFSEYILIVLIWIRKLSTFSYVSFFMYLVIISEIKERKGISFCRKKIKTVFVNHNILLRKSISRIMSVIVVTCFITILRSSQSWSKSLGFSQKSWEENKFVKYWGECELKYYKSHIKFRRSEQ